MLIRKVFVTGVGGQLGYDVMNELAKCGHIGIGSDIQDASVFENYKKLENVEVRVGEYHSCSEALKILKECEERYNEE